MSISVADFTGLRRQMRGEALDRLVANIEAAYRAALGIADMADVDVVWALYNPEGQTAAERAGVKVVRMCIAYREAADGRDGWLDMLGLALSEADPLRVSGAIVATRRSVGGNKTATKRKIVAARRDASIVKAAREALRDNPRISIKALAATLADRGFGGFESLRKRLPGLLAGK